MNQQAVDWKAPVANFIYFLLLGFVVAYAGAKYQAFRHVATGFINDQISGVTIMTGLAPVALLVLITASAKLRCLSQYGFAGHVVVLAPTNFLISATAVAAALNWAVYFSLYIAAPYVARGEVARALAGNALEITAISAASTIYATILLNNPTHQKSIKPWSFWLIFVGSWIVAAGFILRLIQLGLQAAT